MDQQSMHSKQVLKKRTLPKLMACMTRASLENLRNKDLYNLEVLDAREIRRRRQPIHECLLEELREQGYQDSADYLRDLLYDNAALLAEDEIGIVQDLKKRVDYLEDICAVLEVSENYKDKDDNKMESLEFLKMALRYAEKEKGILWLAEKFFLVAVAVASRHLVDGGRQKNCCKFHYGKFLLDKLGETDEAYDMLSEVRDSSIGKTWLLYEAESGDDVINITVFRAASLELFKVLVSKAKTVRHADPSKAERLCRLAERRASDAEDIPKTAEAILEMGISQFATNALSNALVTLTRALELNLQSNNVVGICDARMHLSGVMHKLGDHEGAIRMLTDMGVLAMRHRQRRALGRALHLLGELHLKRQRPDLGTSHLAEAFACFMGYQRLSKTCLSRPDIIMVEEKDDYLYHFDKGSTYEEEAEHSRLMAAISAGQEQMAPYFTLLRCADACKVAQVKVIEWKLNARHWWLRDWHHDLVPCPCPEHRRSPLDVVKLMGQRREEAEQPTDSSFLGLSEQTTLHVRSVFPQEMP